MKEGSAVPRKKRRGSWALLLQQSLLNAVGKPRAARESMPDTPDAELLGFPVFRLHKQGEGF